MDIKQKNPKLGLENGWRKQADATKWSLQLDTPQHSRAYQGDKVLQSNLGGNSAKSIHASVEASLKKLQSSYIDPVYLLLYSFTMPSSRKIGTI